MNSFTSQLIPPQVVRLMSPGDRQALGLLTPEARVARVEAGRESELQRLCELELSRRGIVYLHLSPRAREKVGWPDLTFALAGRPVAVELKTPEGRLSPGQEITLARMAVNGWSTHVVRSFDAFRQILETLHA